MNKPARSSSSRGPSGEEIADWVRRQIRTRRLVPGQRLVEVDIIRKTGGSRFKVREAFQRLAAEGLVDLEEFRGASVRETPMDEAAQLYRARAALEGLCAADFTRNATAADLRRLQALGDQMEDCVRSGSPELFGQLNAEWHAMIMEVSGNTRIRKLVSALNTPVHHLLFETFYQGSRLQEAVNDHRSIIDAVVARDPDRAEAAMRAHIENGYRFLASLERAVHHDKS